MSSHITSPCDSTQAEVDIRANTLSLADIPPITTTLDRYLSIRSLAFLFDTSTTTISKMVMEGSLPRPIYLSPKLPRWRLSDIHNHPLIQYKRGE